MEESTGVPYQENLSSRILFTAKNKLREERKSEIYGEATCPNRGCDSAFQPPAPITALRLPAPADALPRFVFRLQAQDLGMDLRLHTVQLLSSCFLLPDASADHSSISPETCSFSPLHPRPPWRLVQLRRVWGAGEWFLVQLWEPATFTSTPNAQPCPWSSPTTLIITS
ncbi:hypothetical protein OIU78_019178 [Salix suchowensis]|nr:hypothetical protein OIU78_019178 [Salix suchowensis]